MRVPENQSKAFQLAMCERLGLNPEEVSGVTAEATTGEKLATVTITAHLPVAEVREMFNAAGLVR